MTKSDEMQALALRVEELLRRAIDGEGGDRFATAMSVLAIVQARQIIRNSRYPERIASGINAVTMALAELTLPNARADIMQGGGPL